MIKIDLRTARFDRMNGGVQFAAARNPALTIEITKEAIENHFQRAFDNDEAVLKAVEMQREIQLAAMRVPEDDGKIILTTTTLNGREWDE